MGNEMLELHDKVIKQAIWELENNSILCDLDKHRLWAIVGLASEVKRLTPLATWDGQESWKELAIDLSEKIDRLRAVLEPIVTKREAQLRESEAKG